MTDQHDVVLRSAAQGTEGPGGRGVVLVLTFLFMLAAISVSTGLVYTAVRHDFADGLFALVLAVLSARAALSWFWWSSQPICSSADHHYRERLKPADETYR